MANLVHDYPRFSRHGQPRLRLTVVSEVQSAQEQVFETYFCIFSLTLIARWSYWYDTSVHLANKPYFTLSDKMSTTVRNNHNSNVIEWPRNVYIFNALYITV